MKSLFEDLFQTDSRDLSDLISTVTDLCAVSSDLFRIIKKEMQPGVTTDELACICVRKLSSLYSGSVKIAHLDFNINDQVYHHPPSDRKLEEGDLCTVDLVLEKEGFFSDTAWTFGVGYLHNNRRELREIAWGISQAAVLAAQCNTPLQIMQDLIQGRLSGTPWKIAEEACGHGIGRKIHDDPEIPFVFKGDKESVWAEDWVVTIEPVLISANSKVIYDKKKGYITSDGSDAAYFEHIVYVQRGKTDCLNIPKIKMMERIDIF